MLKLLLLVTLCTSVIEVNETDNDRGEKGGDKVPEKDFTHSRYSNLLCSIRFEALKKSGKIC